MRERDVVKSNISDFIDEEQHKHFAACYSQKKVFQIWFFKNIFNVSYLEIKGETELFDRSSYHTPIMCTFHRQTRNISV